MSWYPEESAVSITRDVNIPAGELRFTFARSGGHGGQNVNKVETRVELLFDVPGSSALTPEQRRAVVHHLRSRIDERGILHIVAQESRSQWRNRQVAVKRFIALMRGALKPRRKRIPTRTPAAEREKRLQAKKRRGEIKRLRRMRDE